MWNSCRKKGRLLKAMDYAGLDPDRLSLSQIEDVLHRRGIIDRDLSEIISAFLKYLEPPGCQAPHCKHYTAMGFCRCGLDKIPGRCAFHRRYLKKKTERNRR